MGKDDGKQFKSFKDLLKSKGGEPEAPSEPDEGPGWTLETNEELDLEELPELEDKHSLDRVRARPPAHGPMTHGPKPYREDGSEELNLLSAYRCRTVFPDDVLKEVSGLPDEPRKSDYNGRVDLRDATIFTIDGDDAKDYDDAIGIRELDGGNLEVGVHIADVGHYVVHETALDDEALARGTSVYVPGQVVPMLPEELSNGLCSLVPKKDRLAYSVVMEFDKAGKRVAEKVHKSVIRSKHRNTYRIVQELLDGVESDETAEIRFLEDDLRLFERWTKTQQKLRDQRGSMRIQSTEKKFVFDENHDVVRIEDAPRYFSQTLIEETALAANQAVGDLFRKRGLPTIYRVHPEKDPEEIEAVTKQLEKFGIRVPRKERLSGRDVGEMIRAARRRPNAEALIQRIMGLVERAYYEVRDHEDVAKHWGLAREAYLHFTSPIRRYPDLVVHRWLHSVETRAEEAEEELRSEELVADMNEVAMHCSLRAELAGMCEIAVKDLKVCQFMEPHIGEDLDAKVLRVARYGLTVHLPDFNVSGFLPTKTLGDRPKVEGSTLTVGRGKRVLSFTEGYAIRVKVEDVDFLKLQVVLALA